MREESYNEPGGRAEMKQFEILFKTYYESLCQFASSICQSNGIAEEIVDDVFFNLWLKREYINEIKSMRSYLFTAVKNLCINEIKSARRKVHGNCVSINSPEGIDLIDKIFSDGEALPTDTQIEMLRRELFNSLDKLPEKSRKVFLLSRMHNLSYCEIASELGISVNTVKYHIKQSLSILHKSLAHYLLLAQVMVSFLEDAQ